MGSSPSSSVKPVPDTKEESSPNKHHSVSQLSEARTERSEDGCNEDLGHQQQEREVLQQNSTRIQELEKEMESLQSNNLDLQEQVQALEERLQQAMDEKALKQTDDFTNTLHAKDQYIEKLDSETKSVQLEMAKLKAKCRRKIKTLNGQLSEAKHASSLQIFEMKQDISRLEEENAKLSDDLHAKEVPSSLNNHSPVPNEERKSVLEESCDSRMKIILELSNKLSDQDSQIVKLQNKTQEQKKLIDRLEAQIRVSSANSVSSHTQNRAKLSNIVTEESADIQELKTIAQEMKKLKSQNKKER